MSPPTIRDERLIERIIDQLAQGKSLTAICKRKGMPSRRTVQRWMEGDDDLAERLLEARETGFHQFAEETLDLVEREPDANKARVILSARQWFLGKLSNAFREKPISVGAVVNVDAGDAFAAIAGALEIAAAGIAGRGSSTRAVVIEGAARSGDPAGQLADLDGSGGPGLGENSDGG
jgi:hypothetical protein